MHLVVNGKHCNRHEFAPTRKRVNMLRKKLFKDAVGAISMIIGLMMIRYRDREPRSEETDHGTLKRRCKQGSLLDISS